MSYFGKNIKKLRTVKKLNQTAFAKLFGLKRGSIGAYEEGRAEAKLDTIINIAEYFKLTLNQLLTSELTINEIYHIDKINSRLGSTRLLHQENIIPLVSQNNIKDFVKNQASENYIKTLDGISLPYLKQFDLAFESFDSSMLGLYSGFKQGDILLTQSIKYSQAIDYLPNKSILIILSDNKLTVGFPEIKEKSFTLKPLNLNFQKHIINVKGIRKLWLVKKIITDAFIKEDNLENRISQIERQIKDKL